MYYVYHYCYPINSPPAQNFTCNFQELQSVRIRCVQMNVHAQDNADFSVRC